MRLHPSAHRLLGIALIGIGVAAQANAQVGRVGGVIRSEDGQPLKGATIIADNPNIGQTLTATTDEKGRYSMIGLRSGNWRFIVQAPGFSPDGGQLNVHMGAPNPPVSFVLKKNGVAQFGALGGITGKELQDGLERGERAMAAGQWDAAIEAYRGVRDRSPALAVVNLQIAAAYRQKKDFEAALGAYSDALSADPDSAKAQIGIFETHIEQGDRRAAEAALTKAAASSTAQREVLLALADLKLTDDDVAEATRWFQRAADADPFWGKPLYKLGLCALKSGDTEGAASLMSRVIAVDPESPEAALAKVSLESLKK